MQRKKRNHTILIIISVMLLGIAAFGLFFNYAKGYLRSICNTELEDYATHNAYSTKCELEKAVQMVQAASESFSEMQDLSCEEAFLKLRILTHNTPFEMLKLCTPDGSGINSAGKKVDSLELPGFLRAVYGESNIATVDMDADGKLEIEVSAPVISEGKVIGVVQGVYQAFDLSKIINVDSFGGKGYAALIESDGNVIVSDTSLLSLNKADENYWDFFRQAEFGEGDSYEELLGNVGKKQSGIAVYSVGDEQREMYYTPVGINDWYLLQMVSADVVNNYTMPMTHRVLLLVIQICALLLLLAVAANRQLEQSRRERAAETERFRILADNIPGGVAEIQVDADCQILYANDGFYQLMGYTKEEFMGGAIEGHCFRILLYEEEQDLMSRIRRQIERTNSVFLEYQIRRRDGTVCWVNMTGKVIHNEGETVLVQAVITDITLQKQKTSEIMESAKLDKMTQLYDKVSATEIISRELMMVQGGGVNALLVIDIDNFKRVNDTYGHQVGDEAIILVADVMKNTFRSTDLKGRIGGDEFVVLMRNVTDIENTKKRAEIFLERICSLELKGKKGELSCSVGGAVFNMRRSYTFGEVFHQADSNLYQVKKAQKGVANITDCAQSQSLERAGEVYG